VATVGVGVDLVEVVRVERMIAERGAYIFERLLTSAERAYCEQMARPAEHVAVRLAAKEAVYKALQGSEEARKIGWRDTEVVRADDGRPHAELTGRAAERARELGVRRVLLSLSHTHTTAIAVAILETD
jgi:holo-[acyl-carrier protein] synthase